MSRLEQLPQAIRGKILGYLLIAEHVRQQPNHLLVEHYIFEVSALRVSRAINKEATAILYQQNAFVKVHNDFVDAGKSMYNHEVPFFKLKGEFEHHVAEITIKIDPMNVRLLSMKQKTPTTFLLLLADIPKYTRLLRLLDLANFMAYQIDFKLHRPPLATSVLPAIDQMKLLVPFEQVRGGAMIQNVVFSGPFDTAIVGRVKQAMTQKVAWLRAGAWEIHDIALSIKRMGDWAFRLHNVDMALAKYEDTRMFIKTALTLNTMMKGVDAAFEKALNGMECTLSVDLALIFLSDAMHKEVGKRSYVTVLEMHGDIKKVESAAAKQGAIVPNSIIARYYYLLGIAELGLDHPIKAAKAFVKAYKMVSDVPTKEGYEAAKDWKDLGKNERVARHNAVLASMPKEPFAIPDMKEYCTPEVASEHWIMRELGYQGTIPYEDKIKGALAIILTNKPHPNHHNQGPRTAQVGYLKPEVLRKHVEKYRKAINQPLAQGRLIAWIGLTAEEIGEETLLDHPGYVESMGNRGPGASGCALQ